MTNKPEDTNDDEFTYEYLSRRGISKESHEFFGVFTKINSNGQPVSVGYPWGNDAYQIRLWDRKEFYSKGPISEASLFGMDKYPAGCAKSITIVEGADDALAFRDIFGPKYPVVSVRSASSAKTDCTKKRDYLNSFERIYICFDGDSPGRTATREVATLFDFNKVYDVRLTGLKDPQEFLENGKAQEFKNIWWNSGRFLPEGIYSSYAQIDAILDEQSSSQTFSWPFKTLQEMTKGLQTQKIYLVKGLEGIGKTEFLRATEYHIAKNYDDNFGIIHLEESKKENIERLSGYELSQPIHMQDSTVSRQEIKDAYRRLSKREDRIHIYSHFGSDDPNILLDCIRFLTAVCGCRVIFFDHITRAVTGLAEEDERRALDRIITSLSAMVIELDFALVLVSHITDEGKTRGSRLISKEAHTVIHLDRDMKHENPFVRNITNVTIEKNRSAAKTGPAGKLIFSNETFKIAELSSELPH